MTAVKMIVSGRVQGVGFRHFTMRQAQDLQLSGYVKNLSDGRVEVVAEGPEDAVDRLRQALQGGPRFSDVNDVTYTELTFEDRFDGFSVKY